MIRVVIIGSGNVAHHLISAFLQSAEIQIVQAFARDKSALEIFASQFPITDNLNALTQADLYLIAVSDDAIGPLSMQLPFEGRLVAHTSGSVSIDRIASGNAAAVFYPLQTFSKNKPVDFSTIPICLETYSAEDFPLLEKVARSISAHIYKIDSKQRLALHIAAVFVNNFTNHLYKIGSDICAENNIPFDILKPLILETAEKVMTLSPAAAQTGPARRNDGSTIRRHLEFLSDEPEPTANWTKSNQKNIYHLLTQSIQNGEKL